MRRDVAACDPPQNCQKPNCYTCGRLDGIKHRGGSGPNGELLLDDVLGFWWNHNWITYMRTPNGQAPVWVRQYPGGVSDSVEMFSPEPGDRSGHRKTR